MKFLPAGTTKYLYFDPAEVIRNAQRRNKTAPVFLVAEVAEDDPKAITYHAGVGIRVEAGVSAAYNQNGRLCDYIDPYTRRRYAQRIAFVTTGAVALAEDAEEAQSLSAPTAEPLNDTGDDPGSTTAAPNADKAGDTKSPSKKKPTIKTQEVPPNGEEQ